MADLWSEDAVYVQRDTALDLRVFLDVLVNDGHITKNALEQVVIVTDRVELDEPRCCR